MTKEQLNVLKELAKSPYFKGKDMLEWLIWRNTSEPLYKKGDCFKVTEQGMRIFGVPVQRFAAEVVDSFCWKMDKTWFYHLKMIVYKGEKKYETTITKPEYELGRSPICIGCTTNLKD